MTQSGHSARKYVQEVSATPKPSSFSVNQIMEPLEKPQSN
jgi:hypothetical protein